VSECQLRQWASSLTMSSQQRWKKKTAQDSVQLSASIKPACYGDLPALGVINKRLGSGWSSALDPRLGVANFQTRLPQGRALFGTSESCSVVHPYHATHRGVEI